MQDARSASHVIRGAIIRFSSNGMVQCNSTFRARQIGNSMMPPTQGAWPKNRGWPKGGWWEFRIQLRIL